MNRNPQPEIQAYLGSQQEAPYDQNGQYWLGHLISSHFTQILDVARWRVAKQTTVLAAELGWALIAHVKRRISCIHVLREHQPPRFV